MVLTLLGPRVPVAARAFLVGLAIVDDLGAILIITFVYTGELQTAFLAPAGLCLAVLAGLNLAGIRTGLPYAFAGIVLWGLFTQLGVHGTLAGVVVALAAPVRPAISRRSFVSETRKHLRKFEAKQDRRTHSILEQPQQQELAQGMLRVAQDATVPLSRWETGLQLPISFIVMPLFALMNAGVELSGVAAWSSSSSLGIAAGLLFGKPLGIALGVWLGKKFGIAELPDSLGWRHLIGIGILGGIGFTMSLFIATLSFGNGAELLDSAKQAVIGTSLLAGIIGYAWLRWGTVAVR
jgi:NhaA family Na+:H+ antiporter